MAFEGLTEKKMCIRDRTRAALRGLPACAVHIAPRERMEEPVLFGEEEACSLSG